MAGIYETSTLLSVMSHQRVIVPFYLRFFTSQINFETESIDFDRVNSDYRRLAPFVAPNVQGKVLGASGFNTVSFRPAYVKPKHNIDPSMSIPRQPGEALATGSLTLGQRRDAVIAERLRQHRTMLTNRNEWLAARAIIDAQVTIQGENYPATTVNFLRDASLSYTLSSTAKWDTASGSFTGDCLNDIKVARSNASARSGGVTRTVIFGGDAWGYFADKVDLKELMNTNYADSLSRVKTMTDGVEGVEYVGTIQGWNGGGRMECFVDTSKYVDDTNTEQFFLDQKTVVGVADNIEGVRCFGAIKDVKAGLQSMEIFTKMWESEDPSSEFIMSQSAPLMVPKRPNASWKIKTAT